MAKTKDKKPEEKIGTLIPVTSHAAPKEEDADGMLVGFFWGQPERMDAKGKTPYHFLPDKEGYRGGLKYKPSGVRVYNLKDGIPVNCTLPPIDLWDKGEWLNEQPKPHSRLKDVDADIAYALWVVDGAGQPGNWELICYYLSTKIAADLIPDHPLFWTKTQRTLVEAHKVKGIEGLPSGLSLITSTPTTTKPAATAPKKKDDDWHSWGGSKATQAPSLPAGVRIRCPGCGHWFKEGDLSGHAMVCSSTNGGSNDWAIMCVAECGCRTLDEASTPKPGFPRPKPEPAKKEGGEPVSETIEEPTPEEETPTEETTETPDAPEEGGKEA